MADSSTKFGFNATWSMAVGGMVGGGIFSVLGVVVHTAAQWAWLSFVLAGLIALISAHSYNQLSIKFEKGGGAFTFLNEMDYEGVAASLSWVLIMGYVLTMSVYAFTFGHYVAHLFEWGPWLPRLLAFLVIAVFAGINLRGAGESSRAEIITVWGKLIVLFGLALFGLWKWSPEQLSAGVTFSGWSSVLAGAATIFMAYEGFQLLSYDYQDIREPRTTLPKATMTAVISVIGIYVLVTLGASMLVGAETLVEQEEVALAIAGQKALGVAGLIIVTIAAAFSTGSAINATLFSTARLMEAVAEKDDLPRRFTKENAAQIPYNAILTIAGLAAALAIIGSLGTLVDAASLIFLMTFGIVNLIAFYEKVKGRFWSLLGFLGCLGAGILSSIEQMENRPVPFLVVVIFISLVFSFRRFILKRIKG